MSLNSQHFYRFGDFELQPSRRALLRDGVKIAIAPKTFEVLLCLVQSAGRVVLKEELLKTVWPESFVEESNLTQHIFWLRKALGDKADAIATIPGRGYEFVAPVQAIAQSTEASTGPGVSFTVRQSTEVTHVLVEESTVPGSVVSTEAGQLPGSASWKSLLFSWPAYAALAIVVFAATAFGIYRYRHRIIPGDHHEVVLADFENSTGDPGFDRSLKTLLAIDLNQSPFLIVAPDADTAKVLKLMNRSPEDDLSPVVAREVCERLNDQVVLAGLIARFGQSYLITLTASDCSSGKELVQTKAVAKSREDVLKAVDSVAAAIRTRLGEPLKLLHPPGQPLEFQHTASLEALKLYSQGHALQFSGSLEQAIPLYQRAVELDPTFAAAWLNMSDSFNVLREDARAEEAVTKAYKWRDQTDEPTRLAIVAAYNRAVTGDLFAQVRNYQSWTDQYPQQAEAWRNLADAQVEVGRADLAVAPARRALALAPASPRSYNALARALYYNDQFDEAEAVCRQAIRLKLDNIGLRYWLLNILLYRNDSGGIAEQNAWAAGTDAEAPFDWLEAYVLLGQGRVNAALALHQRALTLYERKGQSASAASFRREMAYQLVLLGLTKEAAAQLGNSSADGSDHFFMVYQVYTGHILEAQAELSKYPDHGTGNDCTCNTTLYPIVRAAISLQLHNPADAIAALSGVPTEGFQGGKSDVPYWSGLAFLANRQPDLAELQFTFSINHRQGWFYSLTIPLSHLGLARSYALQSNTAAARQEYEAFFTLWKDADPDIPVLQQARAEYARLR